MTKRMTCAAIVLAVAQTAATAADAWKSFTKENTLGLPGNEIQCLVPARAGGVWVCTLTGAALATKGGFKPLQDESGKPIAEGVWAVLETAAGPLIGTDNGIVDCRDGRFARKLTGLKIAPIIEGPNGDIWALGRDRADMATLFQLQGKEWSAVNHPLLRRIVDLFRTPNGRLWLTLDGNGVLEIDAAAGLDKAVHHLKNLNVTAVFEDAQGQIWFGLWGSGVAIWNGKEMKQELTQTRESAILAIAADSAGNIWLATSANGLWRRPLAGGKWTQELADQGAVNLLTATRDGRIWISGQNLPGLRYWNGEAWVASLDSPLPIRTLVETADGSLWAGGTLDGLYVLEK